MHLLISNKLTASPLTAAIVGFLHKSGPKLVYLVCLSFMWSMSLLLSFELVSNHINKFSNNNNNNTTFRGKITLKYYTNYN